MIAGLIVLIAGSACNPFAPSNGSIGQPDKSPEALASCEVVVAVGLRLRSGPGTNFDTLTVLPAATELRPRERAPDAQWISVRVADTAQSGWVSAAPEYLACSFAVADLPVGAIPPTPSQAPTPVAQTSPSAEPPTDSPLKRDDPPPEGVAEQLGYSGGAYIFIPCDPEARPRIRLDGPATILGRTFFCATGFVPERPIVFSIIRPDGSTVTSEKAVTEADGTAIWEAKLAADEPLGTYAITAEQGRRRVVAEFKVVPAGEPKIQIRPDSGPPGTQFRIDLAGFPAGTTTPLYLYRSSDVRDGNVIWQYQTTIATVTIDQRGHAVYTLNSAPDDPAAEYRIVTDPPVVSTTFDSESRFEILHMVPEPLRLQRP